MHDTGTVPDMHNALKCLAVETINYTTPCLCPCKMLANM